MSVFALPKKTFYFKNESTTPLEMFERAVRIADVAGRPIGCNIFSSNFRSCNFFFVAIIVDLVIYFSISFENIYTFRNDFVRQIFCVATLGMGFQGWIKLLTFNRKREKILQLESMAKSFNESSVKAHEILEDASALEIFDQWMLLSYNVASFLTVTFIGCAIIVLFYPMIYYALIGEKILHFGFSFPGIDWTTSFGYSINFIFHTIQTFYVINVLLVGCFSSIFFMMNAFARYDVLGKHLDKLSQLALENVNGKNDAKIEKCIKYIVDQHVELFE